MLVSSREFIVGIRVREMLTIKSLKSIVCYSLNTDILTLYWGSCHELIPIVCIFTDINIYMFGFIFNLRV